jgi:hypothetical protein
MLRRIGSFPGTIITLVPLAVLLAGCATGGIKVTPTYTTKSVGTVSGEVALGELTYPQPRYGTLYSMGAVELTTRIDYFCKQALKDELIQYGLDVNQESRLQIEAEVLKAETVWLKQGRAGAFKTSFAIRFIVKDREKQEEVVYRQIHEGSASHSQTYGGYPASASVVDALSAVYDRFLKDRNLQQVLVKTRSINLYGQERAPAEAEARYEEAVYRDYETAIKDMSPDILASLEPLRFEGVFAIFGFKNRQGQRNNLSLEVEREIRGYLSQNRLQVVTRELDEVLEEQEMQYSDLFDENTRVDIGAFVGATHLITGSLYHYDKEGIIKLRVEIVEVESGLVTATFITNLIASQTYVDMVSAEL